MKPVSCTGISFVASEVEVIGRIGEAGDPVEVGGEAPESGDERSESRIEARVESPEFKTDAPARIDGKPEIVNVNNLKFLKCNSKSKASRSLDQLGFNDDR